MSDTRKSDPGRQLLLAKRLLERGYITPSQLRQVLSERNTPAARPDDTPLETLLLDKGILRREQLEEIQRELESSSPAPTPRPTPTPSPVLPPRPPGPPTSSFIPQLGKYTLTRELGRGGMGAVYEALDTQLNRKVALKLMIANPHADPQELAREEERFVREAKLAARLKHANIVPVYEAGVIDGRRFLAMELIEGKPFSTWRRQGPYTLRQQVAVLRDVALAIHYAHEQGVLHRDLKPRNILVDSQGHPYVTDFGLAKSIGKEKEVSLTASGMVVGTPTYMSPEQCQGTGRIDWRSDIWSLGVMLYEVLAGRPPFEGNGPLEIMSKVVHEPVVPPSHIAVETALALDSTIENICLKALAKDPKDRYPTARLLAEDLTQWIEGGAVRGMAPKKQAGRLRKPLPKAAGFAALLLLAVLAARWATRPRLGDRLERARAFFAQGDLQRAGDLFSEILDLDPDHPQARNGLKEVREALDRQQKRREEEYRATIEKIISLRQRLEDLSRQEKETHEEGERRRITEQREQEQKRLEEAEKAVSIIAKSGPPTDLILPEDPFSKDTGGRSWKLAVELLHLSHPVHDALWGKWSLRGGVIHSDASPAARLQIPFEPPEEYNLRLNFRRLSGRDAVALILSHKGSPFALEMGADGNHRVSLVPPEAWGDSEAPVVRRSLCLENRISHTVFVRVRREGVQVVLNGVPLLQWKGDPSRLGIHHRWKLPEGRLLGVGSHASPTAFEKLEIQEIGASGRRLTFPPHVFRALEMDPGPLQPGLLGEYFYGTSFEVPAFRRIDPSLSFKWGEGSAWPGGPEDCFSVRWSGFLFVPHPGDLPLLLTADGAARLLIHGQQVLSVDSDRRGLVQKATCRFEAGFHPVTVEFTECGYLAGIQWSWIQKEGDGPSPVGKSFLFHDPAGLRPPRPRPPEPVASLSGHPNTVNSLAFSPDGRLLATACEDGQLRIWETSARRLMGTLGSHAAAAQTVAFSPDGRLVASGGFDGKIKLWDVTGRSDPRSLSGHQGGVRCLAFSPDGRRLASGGNDRTVRLWDAAAGRPIRTIGTHEAACLSLSFSPDGRRLAAGGEDRRIRIWDPEAPGEPLLLVGHADTVRAVTFSPDGRLLASASHDHSVRLWNVETGLEVGVLEGHPGEVTAAAFHPGGRILASGGREATIRIWEAASGGRRSILPGHAGEVTALAFAPGGRLLASGGTDRTIRFWEVSPPGD